MMQNMLKHKIETHVIVYNFILFISILITCYVRTHTHTNIHTHTHTHTRHMNTPYSRNLAKIIYLYFNIIYLYNSFDVFVIHPS